MKTYYLKSKDIRMLSDTLTPVSIYLNIRDKFTNSILLESSDYHGMENSFSYICFEPISSFSVRGTEAQLFFPDGRKETRKMDTKKEVLTLLKDYASAFVNEPSTYKFINNGLFGYMAYDAVEYFEDIDFSENAPSGFDIPEIHYAVYKYVIAVDHFKNELYLFEHGLEGVEEESKIDKIINLIKSRNYPTYEFRANGNEISNYSDKDFIDVVQNGINHCLRGDVIQIVLSRRFQTTFHGDDFNVYRILRSINPSPYLFYFDYGNFKIFGSSPEAQIQIKDQKASIFPIAGTFKRTGNDNEDLELAKKLANDPKEISEHVMLVDLARNDLSRNSYDVEVETFKEVQYYSHVIHLVSKVSGHLTEEISPVQLVADTFPAGTLSGAPKHMAMQLINKYENVRRGFYGGAIGFMGFNGDFNHAIMIRSFLSKNNTLFYQAGAGVVAKSIPESELQEVNNKLAALRKALEMAETIKA
jgi:anthranilate synthase component I